MSFASILAAYKTISTFKSLGHFLMGGDPDNRTPPALKKALAEGVDVSGDPRFTFDSLEGIYVDRHRPLSSPDDTEGEFEEADIYDVIDAYEEAIRYKEAFREAYHHWRKKALEAGTSLKEK